MGVDVKPEIHRMSSRMNMDFMSDVSETVSHYMVRDS
jgi:hypothetical protein